MSQHVYLIAGGDLRQLYLARSLARDNKVYAICFDEACELDKNVIPIDDLVQLREPVDYIVLPLPVSNNGITVNTPLSKKLLSISEVLEKAGEKTIVFGGKIGQTLKDYCERSQIELIDYFEREELAVLNAVPTAEGTLQLVMEELPTTLFGSNCLVTGFGRISKVLVKLLTAMGANVTVAARRFSDLAWGEIYGCRTVHMSELSKAVEDCDLVINTVPYKLFDYRVLSKLKDGCLVIDLASKPGGADFEG